MTAEKSPSPLSGWMRAVGPRLGLITICIGGIALVGWATDNTLLKCVVPGMISMKVNTAVGLMLLGLALFGVIRPSPFWQRVVPMCLAVVSLLSLMTLTEYAFGIDLRIDTVLFQDPDSPLYPGRNAPATNFAFLGMASAFGMLFIRRGTYFAQILLVVVALTPLTTLGGYLYHAPAMYEHAPYPAVALNTAVSLLLLCIGGLFAGGNAGMMGVITANSLAGSLARKLLPAAIGLPFLTGLLVLAGERSNLYSVAFGSSLMVTCCAFFFAAAVCWSVILLSRADAHRANAVRDRAQTERKVTEGEQHLRIAIETARLGSWQLDLVTMRVEGSPQYLANFGLTQGDSNNYESLIKHVHDDDRARLRAAFVASVASKSDYREEYRVIWPDGSVHWLIASGRPIYDETGRPIRMVGVTMDVTADRTVQFERERLFEIEREARGVSDRANRMKDEFLATLSHELRTPLSAILGWSQILRRAGTGSETLVDGLGAIERNARSQSQIIGDLLDMSGIISGKVSLKPQRLDLLPVLVAAIDTVQPTASAKSVEMRFEGDAHSRFPIVGDVNRLQQVFWNLLSNAIKFTPRGGKIGIRVEQRDSMWQAIITDTGEGISTDFLPFVFDRFRQEDASTTRKHGGLGLGLAIVKQLVELHGGTVEAESGGLGKGSTFTVSLPVRAAIDTAEAIGDADPLRSVVPLTALDDASSPREAGSDSAPLNTARGRTVLIVDDEPDARAMLRQLLAASGAIVHVAGSADEALRLIVSEHPDILVSDIGMPGSDGYDLIRRVRQLPGDQGGRTLAIALTAYARAEDRMKAVQAGFQTHVPKPVEPAELLTMIGSLLENESR